MTPISEATWPDGPRPQMAHLDLTVPTTAALDAEHRRALGLGARLLRDRSDDPDLGGHVAGRTPPADGAPGPDRADDRRARRRTPPCARARCPAAAGPVR